MDVYECFLGPFLKPSSIHRTHVVSISARWIWLTCQLLFGWAPLHGISADGCGKDRFSEIQFACSMVAREQHLTVAPWLPFFPWDLYPLWHTSKCMARTVELIHRLLVKTSTNTWFHTWCLTHLSTGTFNSTFGATKSKQASRFYIKIWTRISHISMSRLGSSMLTPALWHNICTIWHTEATVAFHSILTGEAILDFRLLTTDRMIGGKC